MTDIVDGQTRSKMMAKIRSQDTKPEMLVRKSLHKMGIRYRLHVKGLSGKPDLVFPKYDAVLFIHGCFWHRHENCKFATMPATRVHFWEGKFKNNVNRDANNMATLAKAGWRVGVVWECATKRHKADYIAEKLLAWLEGERRSIEIT